MLREREREREREIQARIEILTTANRYIEVKNREVVERRRNLKKLLYIHSSSVGVNENCSILEGLRNAN